MKNDGLSVMVDELELREKRVWDALIDLDARASRHEIEGEQFLERELSLVRELGEVQELLDYQGRHCLWD